MFSTPLWIENVPNFEAMNEGLLEASFLYKGGDYFEIKLPAVATLYAHVLGRVHEICEANSVETHGTVLTGRQQVMQPRASEPPHWHPSSKLVAVYYVNRMDGHGDLLLHDPRGGASFADKSLEYQADCNSKTFHRIFHRIKHEAGLLVIFPGDLAHSVEVNLSTAPRISIAMAFRESSISDAPTSIRPK